METLNVAVIGAGILGEVHAKAYAEYHRSELLCVCDIDAKRARRLARRFGCKWTTKPADIAKDKQVRAVSVATPDHAHRDIVLMMLKAGKNVLCEKPLATKSAEARAMVTEAKKRDLRLMVDFHNRWNPLFVEAKKQIDSGIFGDFVMGYARLSNTYWVPTKMISWAGKTGPESFLMPHLVDTVRWLTGSEPVEVYAAGQKRILKSMGIDAYDAVQAAVKFDGGAFCTFESAWIMPESWPSVIDFKVSLQGSKGKIEVIGDNQGISVSGRAHRMPTILPAENAFGKAIGFFHEPMLHFVDCILDGREPAATGEDGLVATEVIEAVHKSIRTGKPVRIRKR